MELRPYQQEAKTAVFREWEQGHKKTLLVLPTGTGKTIVFAKITEDCVRNAGRGVHFCPRGGRVGGGARRPGKDTGG